MSVRLIKMAAAKRILFLALISCFVQRCTCAESVLTLEPDKLVLNPDNYAQGGTVTATCGTTPLGPTETLVTLSLRRTVAGSAEEQVLVSAITAGRETIADNIPGGSGTNNISPTGGDVKFTMTQAKCPDGGKYTCEAKFFEGTTVSNTSDDDLTVEVSPWHINLRPTPSGKNAWLVGEVVEMLCNAPVGTVVDGVTMVEWVWQFKKGNNSASRWETYSGDSSDIEDVGDPIPVNCYQQRSSRLTRNLTLDDSDRIYRCFIHKDGQSYTEYAAEFSVGTVSEVPVTTPSSNGDDDGAKRANVGGIVGGVIGALVGVIVVIIIVVVIIRRRKSKQGEDYRTDEGGNKPAEEPNAAPYTVNPAVTYSQPNRFRNDREPQGVSNKAMDEASDKSSPRDTRPPRYANDFHQGRPNRGFSYDPEGRAAGLRRHSSDEDGTDSRVNTSQQSIGYGDPSIGTAI